MRALVMRFRMDRREIGFDWNQTKAFLTTAETGSLSAAARRLGLSQPTLSRQVAALEEALGVTLFERLGRSLALTGAGRELLEHARAMGAAADRFSLTATGQAQDVEGLVRITASEGTAICHVPAILERLKRLAPGIVVEVVASNEIRDLQRREADIAIRHQRPEQPELITRRMPETTAHLYAATRWLDIAGRPGSLDALAEMPFVGIAEPAPLAERLNAIGLPVRAENIRFYSASGPVYWAMVRQGLGIGIMSREIAALAPEVEQVLPGLPPIPIPVWLVTHRELRTSRRIRLVFDLLAEALAPDAASKNGAGDFMAGRAGRD
ncbi:MAG: LysR family transcriptional regulator [Pseudomonadota bacterium]